MGTSVPGGSGSRFGLLLSTIKIEAKPSAMSREPTKAVPIKRTHYPTEAFISRTRTRLGASNRNSGYPYAPIGKLPVELLLHIFHECEPHVQARLLLSHTCRHWRAVTIGCPLLWTNLIIFIHPSTDPGRVRNKFSLLATQLDRARDSLLDVHWYIYSDDYNNHLVIDFLLQRASFRRWRTLDLQFLWEYRPTQAISQQCEEYAFPNLQSLKMNTRPAILDILEAISRTTTSAFKVLELYPSLGQAGGLDLGDIPRQILGRVTRLILPMQSPVELHLPRNVVYLRAKERHKHLFPYILQYELSNCVFITTRMVDLRSLTKLTIHHSLTMCQDCQVILPALRDLYVDTCFLMEHASLALPALQNLHVGELSISDQARLEGPLLERLYFQAVDRDPGSEYQISSKSATDHPGYLLSPSISLKVDIFMSSTDTIKLLGKHSQVQEVTLHLDDPEIAHYILESMCERSTTGVASHGSICPRLKELRLDFDWTSWALDKEEKTPVSEMGKKITSDIVPEVYTSWRDEGWRVSQFDPWKARAALVVSARRTTGVIPDIYASWTDRRGYVLLT